MGIFKFSGNSITEALKSAVAKFGEDAKFVKSEVVGDGGYEVVVDVSDELVEASEAKEAAKKEIEKDELMAKINSLNQLPAFKKHRDFFTNLSRSGVGYDDLELLKEKVAENPDIEPGELESMCESVFYENDASIDLESERFIALVGPSGMGKTKVAMDLALMWGKKAAIVSFDTSALTPNSELHEFGKITQASVFSCFCVDDMEGILAQLDSFEKIIVDCGGVGPYDSDGLFELSRSLREVPCRLLVLSVVAKAEDLQDAAQNYEILTPRGIVLTKFDETTRCGNVFSLLNQTQNSVLFCSTHKAAGSLEAATPEFLIKQAFWW